jgi:hypothetical protein
MFIFIDKFFSLLQYITNVTLEILNMDCLSKKFAYVLFSFTILLFAASPVRADYSSISFSPATGTIYGDSTAINLYVDSGSDEYVGVDVNISFSGSVQYLSGTESKCSSFVVTQGEGSINVECLYIGDGSSYKGNVATLYFKATAAGSSTFSFSSTDPTVTSPGQATYTLSTASTPASSTGGLPNTGLFDSSNLIIAGGLILILVGVMLNKILDSKNLFLDVLGSTQRNLKSRKEDKRRKSFEKKF